MIGATGFPAGARPEKPDPMATNNIDFRRHVDDLKAAMPGSAVAAAFGLTGRGKRFFCPDCQPEGGKTPDLDVFDVGFRCYKCGRSGDVVDLVAFLGRMSVAEAIRWLQNRTGIDQTGQTSDRRAIVDPRPVSVPNRTIQTPVAMPDDATVGRYLAFLQGWCERIIVDGDPRFNDPKNPRYKAGPNMVAEYLSGRGIDPGIAQRHGVRYLDAVGYYQLEDGSSIEAAGLKSIWTFAKHQLPVIVFPYLHDRRPVFLKFRSMLSKADADRLEIPRFLNSGGPVPCLWNHDVIRQSDRILICEGEVDALSAVCAGHAAVGLPGWSHWKDQWVADFDGKDVLLVMDADAAGDEGVKSIASSFRSAGRPLPRQVVLPAGMDLNDYLRNAGTE